MEEETVYNVENLPATRDEEAQLPDSKKILAVATERARHFEIMQKIAFGVTQPNDWINYGGKPGMNGPGAERIMRTFGLQAFNKKREKIENQDGSYIWQVTGQFGMNERETIDIIGTCASNKPFFAKRDGKDIPSSEVDESNIIKNADTNFYVNGVSRFLGLRGLTWERIEELTDGKLNKNGSQKVDYGSKKTERSEDDTAQATIVWQLIMEMNGNSVEKAKNALQNFTKFKPKDGNEFTGYKDVNKVSSKILPHLYKKVEKAYEGWGFQQKPENTTGKKKEKKEESIQKGIPGMEREPGIEG